jgi:hypothetical protein
VKKFGPDRRYFDAEVAARKLINVAKHTQWASMRLAHILGITANVTQNIGASVETKIDGITSKPT